MANQDDRERRRAALSAKFSKMSIRKKAKFDQRLKGENRKGDGRSQIRPRRAGEDLLLSFAQSRLWFLTMLDSGGTTYNIPTAASFTGAFSAWALERSFNAIITRHESLRTTFTMKEEQPVQRISPPKFRALSVIDLHGLALACRGRELKRQVDLDVSTPFSLSEGPLLRFFVFLMGEGDFTLTMNMHHIVSDGWSMGVMGRELKRWYQAFLFEKEVGLTPLSIQYPDFALWQREWLQGEVLEEQISFWRAKLKTPLPLLELNTDFPRPPIQTNRGSSQPFETSPELAARLRNLCRQLDTTMFNLLLAAVKTLFFRYTSQTDLILGTPVTNRNRIALEPLIGFFINTLALRGDLSGNPSFEVLVGRIKKMSLAAFSHQDVPFERLVEEIQPQRDLSRPPIFQILFTVQNELPQSVSLAGLSHKPFNFKNHMVKLDMDIRLVDRATGIGGAVDFNIDLFHQETIERMGEHLQVLLESIVADPSQSLSRLSVAPPAERRRCLVTWNQTESDFPGEQPIGILLVRRARQRPDAVAVSSGESRLTYAVLSRRAHHLAAQLERLGLGPETPVGICLAPSDAMVIGLLGILLSGGVYVPLDPVNPPERLAFMLAESGAALLLTDKEQASHFGNCPVDLLFWEEVNRQTARSFEPRSFSSHQLAYIMFTSGSTGRPKGIAIRHRSVLRRVCGSCFLDFRAGEVVAQASNISFDAATIEIWGALLHGCELTLIPKTLLLSSGRFVAHIRARYVEIILLTPALFNQIVKEIPDAFAHSGQMLIGGEAADPRWMATSLEHGGPRRLLHGYGPTENTTLASWYQVDRVDADAAGLSIGRPVDNAQIFLVDPWLNPVPLGAGGELLVGGDGLARGYWSQPALTAERFIPNPFATRAGSRLYRSGDLVRYLPSGNMIFMGRLDFQIKIRGVRFEPGEVEALLGAHPKVKGAVVLLRADGPAEARLVAYVEGRVAPDREDAVDVLPTELRLYLKDRVPDYMIPSALVILDQLPLNPNGKIDRPALARLPQGDEARETEDTPAETDSERRVAQWFGGLLKLEKIGRHDDFFQLGGHSLLASRLISKIRSETALEVPLQELFKTPVVADFAACIDRLRGTNDVFPVPAMAKADRSQPLPLSFAQQRLWFLSELQPGDVSYNMPLPSLFEGFLDVAAMEGAFGALIRRHENLRTTFADRGPAPLQIVAPFSPLQLRVIDLTGLEFPDPILESRLAEDAGTPFDLRTGPLMRTALFRLGPQKHALLLNMHHIISDGWSLGILTTELAALYGGITRGNPSPLPRLAVQYADYAVWQRAWLQGPVLDAQLDYWRERLAGELPVLALPIDLPRPVLLGNRGADQPFEIDETLTARVRRRAQQSGTTLFMLLLPVFKLLLSRYSGQNDLIVGTPIANRDRAEIEPLIGFFVNTLALRTKLDDTLSFCGLLDQMKTEIPRAFQHGALPFEKLVEELQPRRDMSRSPIFQVMFSLENNAGADGGGLPGLTLNAIGAGTPTSKFELTMGFAEQGAVLGGSLEYNTELFVPASMALMAQRFLRFLENLLDHPDAPLRTVEPWHPEEMRRQSARWNATATVADTAAPLPERMEDWARRSPHHIALFVQDRLLDVASLNGLADRLAATLRREGVGPEVPVGLLLEPCCEMIAAQLAVLRSGGYFVPLDPKLPADRLAYMLDDAELGLVITRHRLRHHIAATGCRLLLLDDEEQLNSAPLPPHPEGAHPAYLIYTSGSTGRPKGVLVTRNGLREHVAVAAELYGFAIRDRMLQTASFSFDVSLEQTWPVLWAGGSLGLMGLQPWAPDDFGPRFAAQAMTHVDLTPAYLHEILLQWPTDLVPRLLESVSVGGEALTAQTLTLWFQSPMRRARLWNAYGPTETVMTATALAITARHAAPNGPSIGSALPFRRLYVMDALGRQLPVGIPGELYIGGPLLARAYLRRPGFTAAAFLPDPWAECSGARMYRSGDRVRWNSQGDLEFLGRLDHQVKIRGFRIETGEIETVLAQHAAIDQVLVLAVKHAVGGPFLAALLVTDTPASQQKSLMAALSAHAAEKLPVYMIPDQWVFLESFPLTQNGKIDRRVLEKQALEKRETGSRQTGTEAPLGQVELQVAAIFETVLGPAAKGLVGRRGHFFELGGHSLLATRVISRVRRVFGLEMPLQSLFEAPVAADFAQRIGALARSEHGAAAPPLVPVDRDRPLPLSFAQQRLWFLNKLQPGSDIYNMAMAARLKGDLDVAVLERCFDQLTARHESLRTRFSEQADLPFQEILPFEPMGLDLIDLSRMEPARGDALALDLKTRHARMVFDLERGGLCRFALLRIAPCRHDFMMNMHHIISDGWSMELFMGELTDLYRACLRGEAASLPPLALQYADFAVWQRSWLRGETLAAQLDFWRQTLSGAPPSLDLPTDRPYPAVSGSRGGVHHFSLDQDVLNGLRQLCRQGECTLFMALLAAFKVLLSRYSGQEDVVLGTPIANRNQIETEAIVGFFVNILALRTDLRQDPSFEQVLKRVRSRTLAAFQHQDLPFEKLVEALQPERNMSRTPLFQVMFALQNIGGGEGSPWPGLEIEGTGVAQVNAKFELTLTMAEAQLGLVGAIEYKLEIFDHVSITAMAVHLEILLRGLLKDPTQKIASLPLLPDSERETLLVTWNDTAAPYPKERGLASLFEDWALRTPDRLALCYAARALSYACLNQRATHLAAHLRRQGVSAEVPVGLFMAPCPELIIAVLAIIKAGGVYVPLETDYPENRLAHMIADSGANPILVDHRLRDRLPRRGCRLLNFHDFDLQTGQPGSNPSLFLGPDQGACMFYTSGSTGLPKGSVILQRSLIRLVFGTPNISWCEEQYYSQLCNISFDAASQEIWGPLLKGAVMVGIDKTALLDTDRFVEELQKRPLGGMFLTTALFHRLAETVPAAFARVDTLMVGGEALQTQPVRRLFAARPPGRFINGYGPTENTTFSAAFVVAAEPENTVPIGVPYSNSTCVVLSAAGRLQPIGVAGELCLGGDGLMRGYFRQPALNAEKLIPDAFLGTMGGRLYRSGDLVRWRRDGKLEYLGRLDHQLKIRGFRIECGEIQAVLERGEAVLEAVVQPTQNRLGELDLTAFVRVASGGPSADSDQLRAWCEAALPAYMVPARFLILERFPLTANGKIDRRVLEKQVLEERETGSRQAGTEAPLGQVEQQVAAIFETVLGPAVKGLVGRRAHFFELGGHSLLATRVISRVRRVFRLEIPLQSLFEAPVVADFAQRIGALARTADGDAAPLLVPVDRDRPLPLSFAQQRLWFLNKLQPGSDIYNMPMAARLKGNLDVAALERCFDHLADRHESLRTCFSEEAGMPSQVILPFEPMGLALIDLFRMEPTRGDALALDLKTRHARMLFDLGRGGLFRFALLRIAPCRHDFMMNMHHIISDGWSMELFMGELTDLYRTCLRGEAASLPPLALQYADFAVWQRSWLRGETLAAQLDFWRQTLSGAPPSLDLPTDRPYPAVSDSRGGVHHFSLDQDLLNGLRQLCRQGECTLFMVLLAAFKVLLSRYSGQEDVVVGTPIANRNQIETEAIVGFFVNTLALRTDLRQDPSFEQVLARVRSRTLAAFQHQDLPFEKLVEALQPERNMSRTPLFQVMFVLQNIGGGEGSPWPGLEMEGTGVAQVNAKFELTLTLAEAELGLVGAIEYKLEIFDHAFITAMAVHWEILLRGLLKDPTRKIAGLPLLPDTERETLLVTWNDTASPYPKERGLAALFEDWARRTPDRPALCYAARALSYACLNQRAEILAAHLRREGVSAEVPVGLFMAPCPELIIAVLAIIKAGGAYVPLETDYPENRLAHMIADSGANPILVDHRLRDRLPERGCRLLNFHDFDLQTGQPGSNPSLFLGPDQWACMFYTSGSTGLPKGSVILQGSLIRLVFGGPNISWREEQYYSQLCNISFDAASQEIWGPLLRGAVMVGIDKTVLLDTDRFVEELQKRPLGGIFLTTALFHRLAESVPAAFARVETLMVGGEALQTQPVRRLFAALPPGRLINGYGPTENTTFSAAFVVDAEPENTVPIGTPYSNSTCVVLSAAGRLQPIGVAGELCLGGDGLMRGYFQRSALNAEKLIPDAFLGTAGGRLYRSGDLVRWRRDGKLEYLGRLDHQLKIRGFRIECGEIQAVLERGEAVLEAVVQPTQNRFGDLGLAAFVRVASGGPSTDSDQLRARCEAALPAYMVPARFLILETFPLTANGKLDRRALIQNLTETVDVSDVSGLCFPDAELDPIEGQIAQIWSELLGLPSFDLTRDFFSLGGHSLLAVRLMEHLKTRFQVDLPLAALFRADTVAAQAQWLRERGGKESDGPLIAVNESGGKAPLYLVHPGGGDILCYAALGREWESQRPLFAFQAPGLHDRHEPVSNLRDLAGLYVEALLKKQVAEPIHLGGWSLGGVIALEMARQLGERGRKVGRVILIDSWPAPTDGASSIPDDRQCAQFFVRDMEQLTGAPPDLEKEASDTLSLELSVALILRKIQTLLQLPGPSGMTRVRTMFGVFRANLKALAGHVPQPYGERPILIQSREDHPGVDRQRLAWSTLIPEGIQCLSAAGNHYSMLQPPHLKQLADTMERLLEGRVE